jgi:hypothetical protein
MKAPCRKYPRPTEGSKTGKRIRERRRRNNMSPDIDLLFPAEPETGLDRTLMDQEVQNGEKP